MTHSIVARLSALPTTQLFRDRGATPAEIAEIEQRNGITLPDDLRETLLFSNGIGVNDSWSITCREAGPRSMYSPT